MNISKKILTVFCVSIIFPLFSIAQSDTTPELRTVQQDSEFKPHVGLGVGVGNPEGSLDAGGNYTLEAGFQPIIPISFIGEYGVETYDTASSDKLVRNRLLMKANYNFGGTIPIIRYAYVGLGLGPMWEDTNGDDGLALAIMPQAGFDYPLRKIIDQSPLTLGANVSQLFTTSDNPDVFAVKGVVKYWY